MDARDILDIHPVYEIDWMTAFGRVVGKTCLSFSEEVIFKLQPKWSGDKYEHCFGGGRRAF